jgi:membrane-bound lytic murein transglycosylase D
MTDSRNHPIHIAGLAACAALAFAAGCAGVPPAAPSSLPEQTIVNEPEEPPFPDVPEETPSLPAPELQAPMHDELPPEPVVFGDVLDRVRDGFALPDVEHPRIDRELAWLQRNPDYVARVFDRARFYLHYIESEVEARGLPGELALLPVVESAYFPFGYSRSHASGLWQFIAPTGERFGLKRNYWQDQRRDVMEATRAALDYLTELRDRFDGDWFLAIAAYNYGAGNIQRAINRNLTLRRRTDFFSLSLPAETRSYVPKLLAVARMVSDPAAYGMYLAPIPDTPYFRVVPTDGPVDLRLMAELAGMDTEQLQMLNPAWNRWLSDPDGPHRLLVPEVVADEFVSQLAQLDGNGRARLDVHTVAAGESLASIAGRYHVPESFLDRVNSGRRADLQPGDELLVPAGDVSQLRAGLGADLERRIHRVRSGESLWSISRRYGMTVGQLARMNGISTKALLQPGQRLQVAGAGPSTEEPVIMVAGKVSYTVRRGDTLSAIARRFAVTIGQLQSWNNLGGSTRLRAGQLLTIHVGGRSDVGS